MSCMLGCSNGTVAIATAMVFSSTALFLAMARQFQGKIDDQTPPPTLRSCLSSEAMKRERRKKKKVSFAENVKDAKGNGKEYRRGRELSRRTVSEPVTKPGKTGSICGGISTMPANRMALYNGILRDRNHRLSVLTDLSSERPTKSIDLRLKIVVGCFLLLWLQVVVLVGGLLIF